MQQTPARRAYYTYLTLPLPPLPFPHLFSPLRPSSPPLAWSACRSRCPVLSQCLLVPADASPVWYEYALCVCCHVTTGVTTGRVGVTRREGPPVSNLPRPCLRCQPRPVTARRFAFLSLLCPPPPLPPPCLCARSPHDLRPETYSWSSTPLPLGTSKSDRVSLREGSHRGLTVTVFLHPNALLPVHPGGGIQGAFPLWRPPVVISNNNNNNNVAG